MHDEILAGLQKNPGNPISSPVIELIRMPTLPFPRESMFTFKRSGSLQQFAIEEDGRHICLVFLENDAQRICDAMNAGVSRDFMVRLSTAGQADVRSAEALLAEIRKEATARLK
jgi:hypothetical protein